MGEENIHYLWSPKAIIDVEGKPQVRFIDGTKVNIDEDVPCITLSERDCINANSWGSSYRARIHQDVQRSLLIEGKFLCAFNYDVDSTLKIFHDKSKQLSLVVAIQATDKYFNRLLTEGKINGTPLNFFKDKEFYLRFNLKDVRIYKINGTNSVESNDGIHIQTHGYERLRYCIDHEKKCASLIISMSREDKSRPIYIDVYKGCVDWIPRDYSHKGIPLTDDEIELMKVHLIEAFKVLGRPIVIKGM
jgi:hypothetical protein